MSAPSRAGSTKKPGPRPTLPHTKMLGRRLEASRYWIRQLNTKTDHGGPSARPQLPEQAGPGATHPHEWNELLRGLAVGARSKDTELALARLAPRLAAPGEQGAGELRRAPPEAMGRQHGGGHGPAGPAFPSRGLGGAQGGQPSPDCLPAAPRRPVPPGPPRTVHLLQDWGRLEAGVQGFSPG